jgi:branched-subunit amino acid ABC-type transport system permease component
LPPAGIVALGLVQGALAGLNALGFVLLYRTTRVVNLAQPALGLVGGVLVGLLVVVADWSFWWALPIGLATGAVLGLASERLVLARLREAPRAVVLVATLGLAQILAAVQQALPFAFGAGRFGLPTYTVDLGATVLLDPVLLLGPHLMTLAVFPVAAAAAWWFLDRSRTGLAAQALGQDSERARALGVPAGVIRSMVWTVAGLLSAVSGVLSIPVLGFSLGAGTGPTVLLLALAPAVFAGLRSIPRAAVAALVLGVLYQALLWETQRPGAAELLLAGAVVVAVALQRRQLGRGGERASSWPAAAAVRPLSPATACSWASAPWWSPWPWPPPYPRWSSAPATTSPTPPPPPSSWPRCRWLWPGCSPASCRSGSGAWSAWPPPRPPSPPDRSRCGLWSPSWSWPCPEPRWPAGRTRLRGDRVGGGGGCPHRLRLGGPN